jgi:peroxiredoxin family protein
MDAMGVGKEELVDGLTYGGVATCMADAVRSRVTLFI